MSDNGYEPFLIEVTEGDQPYESTVITEATLSNESGWNVNTESGWSLFVPVLPIVEHGRTLREPIVPCPGAVVHLYGSFGHPIQGIRIDDAVVFYRDFAQREASRRRWLEDLDASRRRAFTLQREEMDATFDALPDFFKARIDRFRGESPDFRKDSERYEVFCCTEAVKIADAIEPTLHEKTDEAIQAAVKAFHDMPYEEQREFVDLGAGHSGNTFGGACHLAAAYLRHRAGQAVSV